MSVVLVTGLPAAGKTTLATNLARLVGRPLLSRDAVKADLYDRLQTDALNGPPLSRLLSDPVADLLVAVCLTGIDVIVDTVAPASEVAWQRLRESRSAILEVYCTCDPEEAKRRYAERSGRHSAHWLSSVDDDLLALFASPVAAGPVLRVTTDAEVDEALVARWIDQQG